MSPMRYFIDAATNTDNIVVPLNIHHDHGYAKLSSQSCMPSSTDHGSPVNVDDTLDGLVSLSPSSDHSVWNSQKENTEKSDAEYVLRMTAISLMMPEAVLPLMRNRESVVVYKKQLISLFCTCKTPRLV